MDRMDRMDRMCTSAACADVQDTCAAVPSTIILPILFILSLTAAASAMGSRCT